MINLDQEILLRHFWIKSIKGYDGSSKDTERQYLIALAAMSIEAIQNKRNNLENKSFSYDKLITVINSDIYEFEYKILSIREF